MLVLSRRVGETVLIGDDIRVKVTAGQGGQVRIGIDAPVEIEIVRAELADADRQEQALNRAGDGVVEDSEPDV